MSRYVPPALRNRPHPSGSPASPALRAPVQASQTPGYTLNEIQSHYFPDGSRSTITSKNNSQTKTLNDSASTPGRLAFITLFRNANPRWEKDKIIYTKSALQLLSIDSDDNESEAKATITDVDRAQSEATHEPLIDFSTDNEARTSPSLPSTSQSPPPSTTDESTEASSMTDTTSLPPIAVYNQTPDSPGSTSNYDQSHARFNFCGYYNIANLQFLQPRSPELIRMLEQKWTLTHPRSGRSFQKSRPKEEWDKSLSFKWAVIKLQKDQEAFASLGRQRSTSSSQHRTRAQSGASTKCYRR